MYIHLSKMPRISSLAFLIKKNSQLRVDILHGAGDENRTHVVSLEG